MNEWNYIVATLAKNSEKNFLKRCSNEPGSPKVSQSDELTIMDEWTVWKYCAGKGISHLRHKHKCTMIREGVIDSESGNGKVTVCRAQSDDSVK